MAAQQKQGYCELPGSRVGMRFPLVQHPGTQCRCKEKWRRLLKSSALCSLFCLCLCGSNKIGPRWECKNSYRTKCLMDQESSGTVRGGWSRVGPTSSSWQGEVTHGSFAFGVLGAAFGALCNSSFCQGPEQRLGHQQLCADRSGKQQRTSCVSLEESTAVGLFLAGVNPPTPGTSLGWAPSA